MGYKKHQYNKRYFNHIINYLKNHNQDKFKNLLGHINTHNKKILDLGCGTGQAINELRKHNPKQITGIDFSKTAIKICKQKYPKHTFKVKELKDLKATQEYDIITLIDVIEHIPNKEMQTIYPKISKALKPNGLLIIKTPLYKQGQKEYEFKWDTKKDYNLHINIQTEKQLQKDLQKNGFKKHHKYYYSKKTNNAYKTYGQIYNIKETITRIKRIITNPKKAITATILNLAWKLKQQQ